MVERNTSNAIDRTYRAFVRAAALSVISVSVAAMAGYFLVGFLIAPIESSTNRMKLAAEQSVTVQNIVRLTTALATEKSPGTLYSLRSELARSLDVFEDSQRRLIEGDPLANVTSEMSAASRQAFFDPVNGLDRWSRDISTAVRRDFLSDKLGADSRAATSLEHMVQVYFAPQLSRMIDQYAEASWFDLRLLGMLRVAALALIFFALAAVGALIFWPLANRTVTIMREINQSETAQHERYDEVTGLPNRDFLRRFLTDHCTLNWTHNFRSAILQVELQNFAKLKDEIGPQGANGILRMAALRIESVCRSGDFIARTNGDQIVIVATAFENHTALNTLTDALLTKLSIAFDLNGVDHQLGAVIGISFLDKNNRLVDQVLAQAEVALTDAKRDGANSVQFYQPGMKSVIERQEKLRKELVEALSSRQIRAHFQPIVDCGSGSLVGVEALVRWHHPEKGVLTPVHFLDIAMNSELGGDITNAVTGDVLQALADWDAQMIDVPIAAINMAAPQLTAQGAVDELKWIVDSYNIDPSRIALEIAEPDMDGSNGPTITRQIEALASHGFPILLDDFGTGHLKSHEVAKLSVASVKIDRAFVANIDSNGEQQVVVAEMIRAAHDQNLHAIAEGVETPAERMMLQRLGCNHMQGFLVGEPMSAGEMTSWLTERMRVPA